ncbi:type II secretion system F family protein [Proteiniclasticum ruminis]|uniref:Tight adherence protein B n=1 Tax=Proteiniclasticum ruminis TaxID=398199 RepID=A0A1I5D726_9CLOT|nr:type II secretion system F family protein [Proteiniclasticum ruminis]SFN95035.1 tight adherence protein B [Proteiniclasticum ruminis]
MIYAIYAGVFFSVLLLLVGLYLLFFGKSAQIQHRMEKIRTSDVENYAEERGENQQLPRNELFLSKLSRIGFIGKIYDKNKDTLTKAHLPLKPEELFGISVLLSGAVGILLYLLKVPVFIVIIVMLILYMIPGLYVRMAKVSRGKKLNNQLPEALSILSNGLRAGLSFTQSMLVAGKEMEDPIAFEFNKIVRDNSLGKPIDEALSDFSKRTDDEDIDIFVTAILIQRQVGGNLSEILDVLANTIRDRIKLRGDIKTITAQSKMSAVVVGSIPFVLAIILNLLNPEFMLPLFNTLIGNILIGVVLTMQTIGVLILVKIIKVKM